MKRSPMPRPTQPLRRFKPLLPKKLARTPLTQAGTSGVEESTGRDRLGSGRPSRGRWQPAVPSQRRKTLGDRSEGWCEAQLDGCWGRATDPHHRITRKDGGRHGEAKERSDRMSDLLLLCRPCHRWVHHWPARARALGLLLKEHQEPTQELVNRRGEWGYLTDDGRFVPYEEACA